MARLIWDKVGERFYETGVDRGVLYPRNDDGTYADGVPWNGLTTVTESPSGAEATPVYADNIKYLNLVSAEEFTATIEALTYPDEFEVCNGAAEIAPGVFAGQQRRRTFGFAYRTKLANDVNPDLGYKVQLVYGALAAPSEKAHNTVNDTPEATPFSWEVTTTPAEVGEVGGVTYSPTATLTLKSTDFTAEAWAAFEDAIWGNATTEGTLPTIAEIVTLMAGGEVVPVAP